MSENPSTDLLVVNPLPWRRTQLGPISRHVVSPRGIVDDPTAARHFQDRDRSRSTPAAFDNGDDSAVFGSNAYWLPPTELPGFGYVVVSADELRILEGERIDRSEVIETGGYRVTFDLERGGVSSWYDVERETEWIDGSCEEGFAGIVHERVADEGHERPRQLLYRYDADVNRRLVATGATGTYDGFRADWGASRERSNEVLSHRVSALPGGFEIRQRLRVPTLRSPVSLRLFLEDSGDSMVVDAAWEMGLDTHPESTYLTFPFALDSPTPYVDVGGHAMRPGRDQLSGTCHDYYTAQRWVAFGGEERSVTVGCPLNPMVQFGGYHFAETRSTTDLERALLLGWVTSNYWDTNFRARQPGLVRAQYHFQLHADSFDEARAHRLGMEAEHHEPLVQTTGESTAKPLEERSRGLTQSFLDLPEPPVLVHHVRPDDADPIGFPDAGDARGSGWIVLVLSNVSDEPREASIGSGLLTVEAVEAAVDEGSLQLSNGTVSLAIDGRSSYRLRLRCAPAE
ncbi:hypothetical protein [Natronosalvus caseinilyticus]|uniref:hypothetical protein n=1 Tax=Natronosalvus caseinilyticus TaxID=2953747 RepID=UPI0028A6C59A|nr:hypothetical protein [Natronosalvus caseinilyticus]